jgi:hypothetical protein
MKLKVNDKDYQAGGRVVTRIFVYWAGGCWYPNPEHARETVTRESIVQAIEDATGSSPAEAERKMEVIENLGESVKRDGVSDIVDICASLDRPRLIGKKKHNFQREVGGHCRIRAGGLSMTQRD